MHAYLFTWRSPSLRRALGACHALDVPFVFGRPQPPLARPLYGFNGSAARLSHKMQHAWIRFAKSGHPGHERLPEWERYDERRATMTLGRRCELSLAPLEVKRQLVQKWTGQRPASLASTDVPNVVGSRH